MSKEHANGNSAPTPKATMGRIVHYVLENGMSAPAIALSNESEDEERFLDIEVFGAPEDVLAERVVEGAEYSAEPRRGCWSWPPRV